MNLKIQFSNKTKAYVLRVILAGVLALTIGMADAGQTLQAAAEGLAQGETGSPLVGDVRIAPDLGDCFRAKCFRFQRARILRYQRVHDRQRGSRGHPARKQRRDGGLDCDQSQHRENANPERYDFLV
jgi:hypothetical protein